MDLIDRQALLKQIDIDSDGEPGYYGDTWKFIDTIKNLPSATDINVATKHGTNLAEVGTDCSEFPNNSDAISRQAAIDGINELMKVHFDRKFVLGKARTIMQELPPAQPEIIRCRECKFASGDSRICMKFDHSPIGELDFCSFAERREVTT